jgi:phage tail sheath protein FI
MATYLSPGVYVLERPSDIKPIAGVGTSTAGFIGFYDEPLDIPEPNPDYDPTKAQQEKVPPDAAGAAAPSAGGGAAPGGAKPVKTRADEGTDENSPYTITKFPPVKDAVVKKAKDRAQSMGAREEEMKRMEREAASAVEEHLKEIPKAGEVKLVTSFSEFRRYFGGFSTNSDHRNLAHAVYGFFQNGGNRCWVAREKNASTIGTILEKFEGIDEIALVAAPGCTKDGVREAIVAHCEKLGDRFAILDTPAEVGAGETPDVSLLTDEKKRKDNVSGDSNNAAIYFPWLHVQDPATKIQTPKGDGRQYVPSSGHVAGIYARVDQERGVHKAPANEVVRGALDLRYYISRAHQDSLNPVGINCIRDLNGAIRVWGARTIGGDRNNEWKYVNIRRTFLYLKESIDEGTQWVVFEPNDRMLWGKIVRNVSAFLTNVWRDGALFGSTPQEAFYVKCDDETNPPSIREQGQVVTEIGVALTRPAEFVIFRVSQWAGPQQQ